MSLGVLVPVFSFVSLFAYTQVWEGSKHPVSWESNLETHSCNPVGGSTTLNYYFYDKGNYDQITSAARNDSCSSPGGSQQNVRAYSKNASGNVKAGTYAGYSQSSYANQGATKGTDYAYMKVYKK